MNKKDLSQYCAIKREIDMLGNKIQKLSAKKHKHKFGVDTVMSSSPKLPYTKRPVVIVGYGYDFTSEHKKIKIIKQLKERKRELAKKFDEIQAFIASIENSEVRQIIEYKYVDGLSWAAVATRVYGTPTGDNARMVLNRFFEKK